MSCIAGILSMDGAPVERELLVRMTEILKSRAPDECNVWLSDNVGLGHAMLRISSESDSESQPCSIDGHVWITADARIDGRCELIAKLCTVSIKPRHDVPDVELILHAYRAWGESFLDHLIGDFSFALWDGHKKKLICARDQFGVRPFYYAIVGQAFLFASDIDSLLCHPAVSRRLDEEAIGDFLLFSYYQRPELSVYQDIRCLQPATTASVDFSGFKVRSYWSLPSENEIRYRKNTDYVEHFNQLFSQAVTDRLRAKTVAIELSGGMDSTSIAAIAAKEANAGKCKLAAFTITCQGLLPEDKEGYFAGMVAAHLNTPLVCQAVGDYALFDRVHTEQLRTDQPFPSPDLAMQYDRWCQIVDSGASVLLSGQGGDAVFNGSSTFYAALLRRGKVVKFLVEVARHAINTGTFAGMGLRSALIGQARRHDWLPHFPDWINKDFARKTNLEERWHLYLRRLKGPSDAYHQLRAPDLSRTFESYEVTKKPVVARHPFFDTRLATFMVGLPNYIKADKKLLREIMRGHLPDSVRLRPKTPLAGDHLRVRFSGKEWRSRMQFGLSHVGAYVEGARYLDAFEQYQDGQGEESIWASWLIIAPAMLDSWMARS